MVGEEKGVLAQLNVELTEDEKHADWTPPEVLLVLTRAGALELIVATMHFFPTNVYNDMFTDVIGHETYAGTVECAWQNGLIPEELIEQNTLQPLKEVNGETFVHMLLNGYATRKDLPAGSDDLEKAKKLGIIADDFDAQAVLTRGEAAEMCKKLKI